MTAHAYLTTEYAADFKAEMEQLNEKAAEPDFDIGKMPLEMATIYAKLYIKAVGMGSNPTTGAVVKSRYLALDAPNAQAFINRIKQGLEEAYADTSKDGHVAKAALETAMAEAYPLFWQGVALDCAYRGLPAGHVDMVPIADIVHPGRLSVSINNTPPKLKPGETIDATRAAQMQASFYATITNSIKAHLDTIIIRCPAVMLPPPYRVYSLTTSGIQ